MIVLFDQETQRVIKTGDKATCVRHALSLGDFGEASGTLERLEQRIEQLELTLAQIMCIVGLDELNTIFSNKRLVMYDDETARGI